MDERRSEGNGSKNKKDYHHVTDQALRVNAIKYSIDKTSDTPLCRLCNEKRESITHIVSACSISAKS